MSTLQTRLAEMEHRVNFVERCLERRDGSRERTQKFLMSFTKLLATLLGLCFVILTAYQLIKADSLHRLLSELEAQKEKTSIAIREMTAIGDVTARACDYLNNGHTEFNRKRHRQALKQASESLILIEGSRKTLSQASALTPAFTQLEVSARNLRARCHFALSDWGSLKHEADMLITIDPHSWLGYHYRGLYRLSMMPNDPAAKEDLRRSLELDPNFNLDRFNLLELAFFDADYALVVEQMRSIFAEYPELRDIIDSAGSGNAGSLAGDSRTVVVLYAQIAEVFLDEPEAQGRLNQLIQVLEKAPPELAGKFDRSALMSHLQSPRGKLQIESLEPAGREIVRRALRWMLGGEGSVP